MSLERSTEIAPTDAPLIIIGNGIAGLSAAEAARKQNPAIPILIITNESYLTYYRLRLCELLAKDLPNEELYVHPGQWYKERNIEIRLNTTVISIHPDEKSVTLDNGQCLAYSKLIIASGSSGYIHQNYQDTDERIHTIRTLKDAKNINACLSKVNHVVVVGGGLLGLETAYNINKKGVKTTIIEYMPRLLPNQLDEQGSEIFEAKVRSLGINIITNATIESLNQNTASLTLHLNNGMAIIAGMVVYAAGILPNLQCIEGTNLSVNRGIIADQQLRTNIEDIFVAGDVAELNGKQYGLWSIAMGQGKTAGINAAGGSTDYYPELPPYFLNSMDTRVTSLGDIGTNPSRIYESVLKADFENFIYKRLFFCEDNLVGGIFVGDTKISTKVNAAIKNKMKKEDALKELVL